MPTSDYSCRKATCSDNIARIARYLHLTDPYIYPTICVDPQDPDWIRFVRDCTRAPDNIYALAHLRVLLHHDEIIGVACVIPCARQLTFDTGIAIPAALRDGIEKAADGYYRPLISESLAFQGYNVVNFCIDEQYRGSGLGTLLMNHCVAEHGDRLIHLDVIASNKAAIGLYRRCGFTIQSEYMGFSGGDTALPCYHMVRTP